MAEYGLTRGQGNEKDPSTVPSWPVATVVRWTIPRLLPVMSSMAMFFQTVVELESPTQVVRQVVPALKLSPGAGVVGVTSARTARARRAVKANAANISVSFLDFWYRQRN